MNPFCSATPDLPGVSVLDPSGGPLESGPLTYQIAGEAGEEWVHVGAQVARVAGAALRRVRLVLHVVQPVHRHVGAE